MQQVQCRLRGLLKLDGFRINNVGDLGMPAGNPTKSLLSVAVLGTRGHQGVQNTWAVQSWNLVVLKLECASESSGGFANHRLLPPTSSF